MIMYNYSMNLVPTGTFSRSAFKAFKNDRKSEVLSKQEFDVLDHIPPRDTDEDDDDYDGPLI